MAAAVFAEILLPPHLARVALLDAGMLQHGQVDDVLEEPSITDSQLNSAILSLQLPAFLKHPYGFGWHLSMAYKVIVFEEVSMRMQRLHA